MSEEQKKPNEQGCCDKEKGCGCCCGHGRKGRCALLALLIAAAAFGIFQAGRCCGRHCALRDMNQTPAAPVTAPAAPAAK
jgi:hypothetical protein